MSAIRVVLADDHGLLRDGVAAILGADPRVRVVGEASSGPSAVAAACALAPEVVLMDVEMPGGDGLTATRQILDRCPGTRVLVLTTLDLDEYVLQAARGSLGVPAQDDAGAGARRRGCSCASGEMRLAPTVTRRLVETYVRQPEIVPEGGVPAALRDLTGRELDVLRALARGLSNAEIGRDLYLAEATVKTHVTRIFAKLGIRDRVHAVVVAHETGLVRLGAR